MQRRTLISLVVAVCLVAIIVLASLLGYRAIEYSGAFEAAERYARTAPAVLERVGTVTEIVADRSERQTVVFGEGGRAALVLNVTGAKGNSRVYLELREEDGAWKINSAQVK